MTMKKSKQQPYNRYGNGGDRTRTPISTIRKSITYSTDTPDLLLDLDATASNTASKEAPISMVKVKNDGNVSALAIFAFNKYEAAGTVHGTEFLQFLLNPNEEVSLPTTKGILADSVEYFDGTSINTESPHHTMKATTGNTVTSGELNNTTDPVIFEPNNGELSFKVGDLIRVDDEIMEVLGVFGDNPSTSTLTDNHIVVKRGVAGTDPATHSGTPAIDFAFHNHYHSLARYSVAQTDSLGRYKSNNFYGKGRADSGQSGIVAGSVAFQFYTQGTATIPINGGATPDGETGLVASQEYGFDIMVDGSGNLTSDFMKFTVDSSNTKFGGSTGVIAKIQDALDTYYYTNGSNILNERVTVSLENGDIVFRSGSFLSTSAILIAAPSAGETTPFGVGRIPAVSAVVHEDARIETDVVYDPVTHGTAYKEIFIRDDGNGNLIWKNERKVGEINYETGAHFFTIPERPNAEYKFSVLHTSPFSGKLDGTASGRTNALRQVLGNTTQQKCEAKLTVTTF